MKQCLFDAARLAVVIAFGTGAAGGAPRPLTGQDWISQLLDFPYPDAPTNELTLQVLRQDYEQLGRNRSILGTPLTLGQRHFDHGLGTHSISHLRVLSPRAVDRFAAWIGVDNNDRTQGRLGSVVFTIVADGQEVYRSGVLRGGQEPVRVEANTRGATHLNLHVSDAGDGPGWDHADWADAILTLRSGEVIKLGDLAPCPAPFRGSRHPFSFAFGGLACDEVLSQWSSSTSSPGRRAAEPQQDERVWTELTNRWELRMNTRRFSKFPALEWTLEFKNRGAHDTPIIANIQALDFTLQAPLSAQEPYRLHRAKGAPSDPTDFEPATVVIRRGQTETLSAGGGRSSNCNFPFFKVETGQGSLLVAVGWSGQWQAKLHSPDGHHLRITAGMEKTHFKLHPGETARSPRILVLFQEGETQEANAQFRQLIYQHYAARRKGQALLPTLFCNTCFTRGGGWLNECNAVNQISLIRAYAPLGVEALITDAGWFEGGWPAGAGNWTPRKDAYPQGMRPVAAAAQEHGMVYGLWFEPERVIAGTDLHRRHPDWVLTDGRPGQTTLLANFGLPEVRDYFFNVVQGFMALPGFRFYRQDFNMDPLPYWRHHDAPDRQGLTEIRYITGLYEYWDRLAAAWPDSLREECASGGRRIDLETVRRMHLHQKSDYWFDNEVDQASLWTLSQYLPNHVITVPLTRLDEYSFHSTLAASLIPAWIADAPDFNAARAKRLLDRYRAVRHLLVGAWYPLLPYSRSLRDWMAVQFHRPDLGEGLVLVFRRAESPHPVVDVALRGLEPNTLYEVVADGAGDKRRLTGAALMKQLRLTLPEKHSSDLITYRPARN